MTREDRGGSPRELRLQVDAGAEDRVDRFLVTAIGAISRAYAQRLVSAGQVLLHRGRSPRQARKGEMLQAGDQLQVVDFLYPDERRVAANLELVVHVAYEDPSVVVVDKPPGLPSHPNRFDDQHTLVSFLLGRYPGIREVGGDPLRPGIAHRLDTDTSGLLVAARTNEAYVALRTQFDQRTVEKEYVALVAGAPDEPAGQVDVPLGHHPRDPRRMVAVTSDRVRVRGHPREALTLWEVIATTGTHTLLAVRTRTGRMHQVRVHLAAAGLPLIGDRLYANRSQRAQAPRHFLHARALAFAHPDDGRRVALRSPLPEDLQNVLEEVGLGG